MAASDLRTIDIQRDPARRVQQEGRRAIHAIVEADNNPVILHEDTGNTTGAAGNRQGDRACQGKAQKHVPLVQRSPVSRPAKFHAVYIRPASPR